MTGMMFALSISISALVLILPRLKPENPSVARNVVCGFWQLFCHPTCKSARIGLALAVGRDGGTDAPDDNRAIYPKELCDSIVTRCEEILNK